MVDIVTRMIYLGRLTLVDPDESSQDTENAAALAGSYTAAGGMRIVDVTNHDAGDDGILHDDEVGSTDSVSYVIGATPHAQHLDASMTFLAEVTEAGGAVHTIEVVVVQMTNGDTFVTDLMNSGTLDGLEIATLTLTTPTATDFAGYYTSQTVTGSTVCLARGTLVRTAQGAMPIERLRPGHRVATLDSGACPVLWVGRTPAPETGMRAVVVAPGALGPGLPRRRLVLSLNHRLLLRGPVVAAVTGVPEVLVMAKALVGLPGIRRSPPDPLLEFWHLATRHHELIVTEGVASETLHPGPQALSTLSPGAGCGLIRALPQVRLGRTAPLARPEPKGALRQALIAALARSGGAWHDTARPASARPDPARPDPARPAAHLTVV